MTPRQGSMSVVALLWLAAACGSTVAQRSPADIGSEVAEAGLNAGLSAPSSGAVAGSPDGANPAGSQASASAGSGPASSANTLASSDTPPRPVVQSPAVPLPADPNPPAPAPSNAPAVPPPPVVLGLPYTPDASAANAAAGSETQTGDDRAQWETLIDTVNAGGGIAGHLVEASFFAYDAFGDYAAQQEAACTQFTQDAGAVAVLGSGVNFITEAFNACLEDAGVAFVDNHGRGWDEELLRRYPHTVMVDGPNLDRVARATVEGLAAHGWVLPDARIGLVTYDDPTYEAVVNRSLVPALAQHGAQLAEIARVTRPQSYGELGSEAAGVSSAVLQFYARGVDHVLFLELGGDIAFLFMNAAEPQRYYPTYGLNSLDGGMILASQVPPAQMVGAVGIGWLPVIDVLLADDPDVDQPARRRCLDLFAGRGLHFPDANSLGGALGRCDLIGLFQQAVQTSGDASADGFIAGLDQTGGYDAALTLATRFDASRHDGASAYRLTTYFEDCRCLRYTSDERPLP